ncbi:MAG: CDP-diacylglycerol--serine O-phosphatidyltransferase [Candidatus Omnitrophica bacterium]|nr:CDP-diacylglycerol--serine O-phosphatidyltransferase [Candidatus Omnitrophota bacterium]
MNLLANILTNLSLFCGFISIILSLERHFTFAAWAIIISVIFDGIDGQIARRNPIPSAFGKELDSLVDVVAFGIAPSVLGYVFIYDHFHVIAALFLFSYLLCSVLRLAKYNITAKEELANCFIGLPTTASGGILASFLLIYRRKEDMFIPPFLPDILSPQFMPITFLLLVLILSFLMVSRVRYLNLDGLKKILGKHIKLTVPIFLILLILAGLTQKFGIGLFTLFLIYLIFSPFVVKRLNGS